MIAAAGLIGGLLFRGVAVLLAVLSVILYNKRDNPGWLTRALYDALFLLGLLIDTLVGSRYALCMSENEPMPQIKEIMEDVDANARSEYGSGDLAGYGFQGRIREFEASQ